MTFNAKLVHLDIDEIDPPGFSGRVIVSAFLAACITVALFALAAVFW